MRPSGRKPDELREIQLELYPISHAEGSCLVHYGATRVLCTASVDTQLPLFLRGKHQGWITAEYGMLPRATHSRTRREAAQGKQTGRTQEIQRLIGRTLRSIVDLGALGERQIIVDCDVVQADGGTRTASITGGYVALYLALQSLNKQHLFHRNPLLHQVAAVSCGIINGEAVLDLDYAEDAEAEADANFVMTESGAIVEVQATGEAFPFTTAQMSRMMELAQHGIQQLIQKQQQVLSIKPAPSFDFQ